MIEQNKEYRVKLKPDHLSIAFLVGASLGFVIGFLLAVLVLWPWH